MYPESVNLTRVEIDLLTEPWIHDFTLLGFKTPRRRDLLIDPQSEEQPILFALINRALHLCRLAHRPLRGLQLFCNEGLYSLHALQCGAEHVHGFDTDRTELARARLAAKVLGLTDRVSFGCEDPETLEREYDFCICTGVQRFADPAAGLRSLARLVRGPIVLQADVCATRFRCNLFRKHSPEKVTSLNHTGLRNMVHEAGWCLVDVLLRKHPRVRSWEKRSTVFLLCTPLDWTVAESAKPGVKLQPKKKKGLWDKPNKYTRPSGIELGKTITIHGYQEYEIREGKVYPSKEDPPLQRKQSLAVPFFDAKFLAGKTVLDIGANGGFFSFWAAASGAAQVTSLDMDEAYLTLIRKAQAHLGWGKIQPIHCLAQDWRTPADLVLAFAMIHWLYSCTADFGSLDAAIGHLAGLTKRILLIEWVEPGDPAILFFKHTEWNSAQAQGPYTLEAFEAALNKHFSRVEVLGITSPTRVLYAATHQDKALALDPALPLLAPVEKILHSRCLITLNGVHFYSRIYTTDTPDKLIKQTTGDMAMHEAEILQRLQSPFFPRVLAAEQRKEYSILVMEKINGTNPQMALPQISSSPAHMAQFLRECLSILQELQLAAVEHRDIHLGNLLVREDGRPVLIDFGWAQTADRPYLAPPHLGVWKDIPPEQASDIFSMGKVFQQLLPKGTSLFSSLIHLMTTPSLARTLSLAILFQVLNGLELPETWDVAPVFAILKPPTVEEEGSSIAPRSRPPFLRRTWQRWNRSLQKRIRKLRSV